MRLGAGRPGVDHAGWTTATRRLGSRAAERPASIRGRATAEPRRAGSPRAVGLDSRPRRRRSIRLTLALAARPGSRPRHEGSRACRFHEGTSTSAKRQPVRGELFVPGRDGTTVAARATTPANCSGADAPRARRARSTNRIANLRIGLAGGRVLSAEKWRGRAALFSSSSTASSSGRPRRGRWGASRGGRGRRRPRIHGRAGEGRAHANSTRWPATQSRPGLPALVRLRDFLRGGRGGWNGGERAANREGPGQACPGETAC